MLCLSGFGLTVSVKTRLLGMLGSSLSTTWPSTCYLLNTREIQRRY